MDIERIKSRLKSLGYEIVDGDDAALEFVSSKTEQTIKHFCNIDEVPDCLDYVHIEMCCGEFLQAKKSFGQLTSLQVEQLIKSLEDGDTTVSFQSGTDSETRFYNHLDKMINGHKDDLIRHRKLVW